jgi:hypothetical protein
MIGGSTCPRNRPQDMENRKIRPTVNYAMWFSAVDKGMVPIPPLSVASILTSVTFPCFHQYHYPGTELHSVGLEIYLEAA